MRERGQGEGLHRHGAGGLGLASAQLLQGPRSVWGQRPTPQASPRACETRRLHNAPGSDRPGLAAGKSRERGPRVCTMHARSGHVASSGMSYPATLKQCSLPTAACGPSCNRPLCLSFPTWRTVPRAESQGNWGVQQAARRTGPSLLQTGCASSRGLGCLQAEGSSSRPLPAQHFRTDAEESQLFQASTGSSSPGLLLRVHSCQGGRRLSCPQPAAEPAACQERGLARPAEPQVSLGRGAWVKTTVL